MRKACSFSTYSSRRRARVAGSRRLREDYHVDSASNIDGYGGKGQAISKIEQQKMILVEGFCYLAKEEDNNAEVGGDIDSFEIKVMEAVGSVVFGIDAFETQELADAGDKDEERFDEEDGPEEIEVGKNNEVVSP